MELQELRNEVLEAMKDKPKDWRKGQFVFNYIDDKYGMARICKFVYNVDCYYDDSQIDKFIETSCRLINKNGYETIR